MMKLTTVCVVLMCVVFAPTHQSKVATSRYSTDNAGKWPPPPPYTDKAKTARYLAHYSDWGVVSALSAEYGPGMPFGTLQSFADGPLDNSTGIPFFYVSPLSDTFKNVQYNSTVSLTLSEATSDYCRTEELDPEEPTCARVTLGGVMKFVQNREVMAFAKRALFQRHPVMSDWPSSHGWKFMFLDIKLVHLLDFYGGATHVPVSEYFAAKP